jgi:hypothetical protein
MPYAEAMRRGRLQDEILLHLCDTGKADDMSLEQIKTHLENHV